MCTLAESRQGRKCSVPLADRVVLPLGIRQVQIVIGSLPGFQHLLESPGFFENCRTWNVLENHFGPGKSWKLKLWVLESPGKISLKVMHFSSGSNGKQAAIV